MIVVVVMGGRIVKANGLLNAQAMQDGFSTSRSLGLGLPGSRRLMDEFRVQSKIGHGTTVIMRKWLPSNRSKHCCFS